MKPIYLALLFLAISLTGFAQSFNVDFNPTGAMMCPGSSQQFSVNTTGGVGPYIYIWSGDGTNDTTTNSFHTVTVSNAPISGLMYLYLNIKVYDTNGDSAQNNLQIRLDNQFYIDIVKDLPIDTYHLTTSDPLLNIEQVNYSISPDLFSLSEISTWHWDVGTYGSAPNTETLALSLSIPFLDRPCENRDFDIFFFGNNTAGCKLTAYQHMNILNSVPDPPDHFYPYTFTFPYKRDAIDTIDLTPYYNPATCWGLPGHISDVDLSLYGSQSGVATFDGLKVFFNPLNNICDNFSINVRLCLDPPYDNICSGFFDVPIVINCPLNQQVGLDSLKQENVSCSGGNDGSLEVFLRGIPPFHIKWYDYYNLLIDTTFMNSSFKISNLSANQYFLDYDDIGPYFGPQNRSIFITEPAPLKIDSIYTTPSACSGVCKGSATLALSGGTLPYQFLWSNSSTDTALSALCAGSYTISITDANLCKATSSLTIPTIGNNQLNVTIQGDTLNCRHTAATLTAIPFGGQGSYSFLWSSGDTTPSIHSSSISPFSVNVHDSINCGSATFDLITTAKTVTLASITTAGSCNALVNIGTAKIIPSGGTAPYAYLWNTSPAQTTQQASALSNGNHNVTVTDIDSCVAVKTITILPDPIKIRSSITNFSANCTSNGISIIHPYGGVAPYSFLWSTNPPQSTDTAFNLGKGNYSVAITDSLGCSVTITTTIDSTHSNKIIGTVFNDLNKNCQLDSNENPLQLSNAFIKASNGTDDYYSSIDANGNYEINVGLGSWRLSTSLAYNNNCSLLCFSDTANFLSLCNVASKNIFYQTGSGVDYVVHPGWSASRPGFDKTYWIYYSNWSANASTPSAINFVYDSNLIYKNSTPPVFLYDSIHHTLVWNNLSSVQLGNANNYIKVEATFNVPATLPLSTQLNSSMNILPTQGDCAPENNSFVWSEEVTGSHDPNEKIAKPTAEIYQEDSIIQYKINFQNTGTDTAFFIVLRDTLSEYVEPNSVNTIAASHPYSFSLKDKGALSWRFDPILLPDSNTDEKNSHGFVLYSVKRKTNLPLGTEIKNTAHIYFDYNAAVVTNTTISKYSEHVSGISETTNFSKLNIQVYPNPLSDGVTFKINGIQTDWNLRIMNVVGKEVKNIKNIFGEKIFLPRGNISSGIYIFEITSEKELIGTGKLVVN